jgi:hypothetical protein
LLELLFHEDPSFVKDAGICLGSIATVEVRARKWDEFFTIMATGATSENEKFRLAAVQTLGLFMRFIDECEKTLENSQINQVLNSIILNINSNNPELTKIAIQALSHAIPLTKEIFAVDDPQRISIIKGLLMAAEMDDEEIQEIAL